MSIRNLPKADVAARPGAYPGIAPKALDRWNAGVKAVAEDDQAPATISILDVIGEDWWTGGGVSAKRIGAALRSIGKRDVVVDINSPGGDYFEGLAIYELFRQHPAKVTVRILGLAASAASVIAMAGDETLIARSGCLMIHNTWVLAAGDRNAFREVADWLEPFDRTAVDIYAARTGIATAELTTMLDKETWINGRDAVDQGFADDILEPASIDNAAEASASASALRAERKFDILAAKAGVSRTAARELLSALKGSMRGAAPTDEQDAVVFAEVSSLLERIKQI